MLYLKRWTVEGLFQVVANSFHCKIKTLGYPRAALFVYLYGVGVVQYLIDGESGLKSGSWDKPAYDRKHPHIATAKLCRAPNLTGF